ncbi:MAG: GNAT family N-acetyltransferase [Candidatus Omnitrophica bacterium]|nr:GNAT family N-acetyltransferase [Candidatus Omnitrophota bacterium]MCM8817461.1 GNAT family N-acetyltransferase [Candidatus Omnitrophota bacterium]
MTRIIIRPFKVEDRDFVRYLCCETAFFGKPAEKFFEGREVLADILTRYFTDFEPESLFIAEIDGVKAGYLAGSRDIKKLKKIFKMKILPVVIIKALLTGTIFKKKNMVFIYNCAKSFFKKELFFHDFSSQYPATLHINVDSGYRNMKIGEKLVEQYYDYLRKQNTKGVFLETVSERAVKFFQRMGFLILRKQRISYYSHLTDEKVYRFTLGKKLL